MKNFNKIILIISSVLIANCATKTQKKELDIEPFDKKEKQALSYQVSVGNFDVKYPLKLGVLKVSDQRALKYHAGSDDYFETTIEQAFMRALVDELRLNKIFADVVELKSTLPLKWNFIDVHAVAKQQNVDAVLITTLTAFHIFREPINQSDRNYFNIIHNAGFVGTLVYPSQHRVIWSGRAADTGVLFSADGSATPEQIGTLSRKSLSEMMNRFKISLMQTGDKWGN